MRKIIILALILSLNITGAASVFAQEGAENGGAPAHDTNNTHKLGEVVPETNGHSLIITAAVSVLGLIALAASGGGSGDATPAATSHSR